MKSFSFTLFFCLLTSVLFAQHGIRETIKVPKEQVPIAVQLACQKEFQALPDDGFWRVHVSKITEGKKLIAEPLWYSYNKWDRKERFEVRFTPEGVVTFTKGVDRYRNPSDTLLEQKKKLG